MYDMINEWEILYMVPIFIHLLIKKYYTNDDYINFIIKVMLKNNNIFKNIYWNIIINNYNMNIYSKIIIKDNSKKIIMDDLNTYYKIINQGFLLNRDFITNLKINLTHIIGHDDKFVKVSNDIQYIKSATKPYIVNFIFEKSTKRFMIKYRYMLKDYIITELIKLLTYLLKKDNIIDTELINYSIYLVNNNYSIVEIVEKCDTLYNIKSITKYIIDNNPTKSINELKNIYCNSLAFYIVITYILGIGDRHMNNILLHSSGNIFHIDYDYIFNSDPKLNSSTVRITHNMIDFLMDNMGGINILKEKCIIIFNYIKKYFNIIYIMLYTIFDKYDYNEMEVLNDLKNKCQVNINNDLSKNHLFTIIDANIDSLNYKVIDGLYYLKNLIS